jgi:predicted extracellular nuclease/2',3'-cyclic-nucleotide 2'-phosphodiesterase (5'-nucleotidase family)
MSTSVTTLGPESFTIEVTSAFTLELLHLSDQEASSAAVIDAPYLSAVLNALRAQDVGNDGLEDNTLTLASGDLFIPGVFFSASQTVFGSVGLADIQIQNELGIQASSLGNHDFDLGTGVLAGLINGTALGSIFGADFGGTAFPYLSANLDFSTNVNLAPLEVEGGAAPMAGTVTSSVVIDVNGEMIGVIGATTPTLGRISSPGTVGISPTPFDDIPTPAQLDALAAEIQLEVDALMVADTSLNKIILLAHMQRIGIEQELAARLENVDIIVAGGSNTRLLDEDDQLRAGDSLQGPYPIMVANAGGTMTAVVNTDGSYKYLGRLVIDFDADGNIIPESYDPTVSGAYATDAEGVAALGAEDLIDPEIQAIANAIEARIVATESNLFGASDVYLNGNRSGVAGDADGVRTQETNLGNLTADANLHVAQQTDADVVVSIKNGGGIRASIGQIVVPPGGVAFERLPTGEVVDGEGNVVKPAGGISQTDIQTALSFNNGLTLVTVTRAELVAVLEHGLRVAPAAGGQFPQVSGVQFSFDPDLPAGSRILNAEIVDADGKNIAYLVRDGEISGDPAQTFRIVTLNFLAGGGDGYPFPTGAAAERVDLLAEDIRTGAATFADDGSEQDALAEYLASLDAPFDEADTPASGDARMQNLNFRDDGVFHATVINEVLVSTTGTDSEYIELFGEPGASLAGLSYIEVEATGSSVGRIDFRHDFAADDVLGDNGFFLLANTLAQSTYGVTANVTITGSLENSAATYALVRTASLTGTTVTADVEVIDTVANTDTGASNTFFFGAPVVGPDGSFFPAGVGRIADGVDTDTAADFKILNFDNSPTVNTPTPGTFGDTGGGGDDVTIDDTPTLISAVQGTAAASLLAGEIVVIEAIVTGDFQNGDADMFRSLGGFFLMEEAGDQDGSALTSEGIFVYEGSGSFLTDVNAGDLVRVLGTVVERFGKTTVQVTEIRIEEPDAADPLALAIPTELPDLAGREAFESMLVTINEPLTFSESFDYEAFGEATLSSGGEVYQFTQINAPDAAGNAAHQAQVANRQITVDNGTNGSRADFDPITEPDGDLFTTPANALMGQTVSDLTAIMDYDFAEFRLRLPEGAAFTLDPDTNPIQTAPADVASGYKVGSLNVLNYFTTIGGTTDIGAAPRGADNALELERQTEKLVTTILGMDADVIGLVELENDFAGEDFALKSLVRAINDAREGDDVWSWVDPGRQFVGGDAIAVGFIYNTATTALVGGAAILDSADFLDPLGGGLGGDAFNRAALAQSFQDIAGGGIFTAAVNHLKSKGSLTGIAADVDQGDGSGNNNATRTAAAERLAEWLASDPTGSGDDDVMILGDLNAYARETPIQALETAGYTDLARAHEGDNVASYRFSGQIGTLDYAMSNAALTGQVTGATTWNINSDTPVFFDYNLDGTFTTPLRPTGQGLFDGTDPSKSSDHDPLIVGLNLVDDRPILLTGSTGNDRLNGTTEDEIIDARGGALDVVFGGGGEDTFVFTSQAGRRDSLRVLDYTAGDDVIDLNGATLLSSRVVGGNLVLTLDSDRDIVTLLGVTDLAAVTFADPFIA